MTDQLISFKTAKLAKEKGFFAPTGAPALGYDPDGNEYSTCLIESDFICRSTLSLLQKWLREEHEIYVSAELTPIGSDEWEYSFTIQHLPKDKWAAKRRVSEFKTTSSFKISGGVYVGAWVTYEEALEAGLYYALKLIKN